MVGGGVEVVGDGVLGVQVILATFFLTSLLEYNSFTMVCLLVSAL